MPPIVPILSIGTASVDLRQVVAITSSKARDSILFYLSTGSCVVGYCGSLELDNLLHTAREAWLKWADWLNQLPSSQ